MKRIGRKGPASYCQNKQAPREVTNMWRKIGQEDFSVESTAYNTPELKEPKIAHQL